MDTYFESQWHRQPTPAEFRPLVEDKIREEVLYREALAMGLDKDDTIVKRRMAQKMQFLAEDVAAAHEPSTAELEAWFEKNSRQVRPAQPLSASAISISPPTSAVRTRTKMPPKALAKIAGQPEDSKLAASFGDPFMFQDYYGDRSSNQLAKEFGPVFAQIESVPPDAAVIDARSDVGQPRLRDRHARSAIADIASLEQLPRVVRGCLGRARSRAKRTQPAR